MTKLVELDTNRSVSPHWPSAGIVDARAFRVGEATIVHDPTHAASNMIRGRCGVVARIVETDGPRASWADSYITCPTCLAKGARSEAEIKRGCSCGCGAGAMTHTTKETT